MINWESWFEAAGVDPVTFRKGARFTDPMLCLESAIAGHGVMLAWQLLAADALADGRLVAPFGVRVDSGLREAILSQLFNWYKEDFGSSREAVLGFIAKYRPDGVLLRQGRWKISYFEYDWGINEVQ